MWDESADGVLQYSTLTVGVDDTGYDVKFFGATSGAYMLWDESADDLVLAGAAGLDIAGDIDVDGTANLDIVDIDGAVDMATTLAVAGNVDFNGDLDVDGTTNLDAVDIDGALTQDGGAVFNDDSADVDFRVEGNGDTHAFFVQGSDDFIGIGTDTPLDKLHVVGDIRISGGNQMTNELAWFNGSNYLAGIRQLSHSSYNDSGSLQFLTSGTSNAAESVKMTLNTQGILILAAAGGGITFNGDTATANALDDYEEGTWSPTLAADAGPASYTTQVGTYTKVGRLVTVTCEVKIADVGSFSGATVNLGALPFTVKNLDNNYFIGGVQINGAGTATSAPFWRLILNTQYGRLEHNNGATTTDNNMNANVIDTGTTTRATATYFV